uniref:Uncharacterized protein n=1 Tax=Ralstonia solanacearum TaxID=305 RepID=A0A0S4U0H6_RALSL|nr:protein of unknown function [Ralstonia solanacearum]
MLGTFHDRHGMNQHDHGEDNKVQTRKGFWKAFIVTGEPPEAVEPAKATLNDPAPGQQHKAFLGLR